MAVARVCLGLRKRRFQTVDRRFGVVALLALAVADAATAIDAAPAGAAGRRVVSARFRFSSSAASACLRRASSGAATRGGACGDTAGGGCGLQRANADNEACGHLAAADARCAAVQESLRGALADQRAESQRQVLDAEAALGRAEEAAHREASTHRARRRKATGALLSSTTHGRRAVAFAHGAAVGHRARCCVVAGGATVAAASGIDPYATCGVVASSTTVTADATGCIRSAARQRDRITLAL